MAERAAQSPQMSVEEYERIELDTEKLKDFSPAAGLPTAPTA
ncbi:hypothetical protein ACFYSF_16025 [Streptomyces canus]